MRDAPVLGCFRDCCIIRLLLVDHPLPATPALSGCLTCRVVADPNSLFYCGASHRWPRSQFVCCTVLQVLHVEAEASLLTCFDWRHNR